MSYKEIATPADAQSLAAIARFQATLDSRSERQDEDAITEVERPRTPRTTSFHPSLDGSSHSSRATTLIRRSSASTGSPTFYTPPESLSERRTSSFSGVSGRRNSESPAKPAKKNKLTSFFSLKEPSTLAFAEMQALMEEERKKKGRLAVPTGKIPENVPAVNSRWDGLPENARQKHKANKRKLKEKEKLRTESRYHIPIEPIGPISYGTLDPKALGEMPAAPNLTLEGSSSADESFPRTPTSPRPPPLPAPVSREDAAPWEFMEGPPDPSSYLATRPSTAVSVGTAKKGKKFPLFGKR